MNSSEIIKSWLESPAIQAEFGNNFKVYLSYVDACNKGLVRICGTTV